VVDDGIFGDARSLRRERGRRWRELLVWLFPLFLFFVGVVWYVRVPLSVSGVLLIGVSCFWLGVLLRRYLEGG
jgi:hypothetical protein